MFFMDKKNSFVARAKITHTIFNSVEEGPKSISAEVWFVSVQKTITVARGVVP